MGLRKLSGLDRVLSQEFEQGQVEVITPVVEAEDVTIELWLRPDDLAGRHVLFETGGDGNGLSIVLDGNEIVATGQTGTGNRAIARRAIQDGQTNGLIHVVSALDLSTGQMNLYLNGVLAATGTSPSPLTDWAGGDGSNLGQNTNSVAGGGTFTGSFTGDIAIHRVYESQLLSANQVLNNFAAGAALTQANLFASWDAVTEDTASDDPWNRHYESGTAFNWDPQGGTLPGVNELVTSKHPGILAAYQFDGTGEMHGAAHNAGSVNIDDGNFSIELWIKPNDLTGQELLWEAGGSGSGSSIRLDDDELIFRVKNNTITEEVSATLSPTIDHDFFQVVATIDLINDELALYVNGVQVDFNDVVSDMTSWVGGDPSAIGGANAQIGGTSSGTFGLGDLDSFGFLTGQIAIVRYYTGELSADAVRDNYFAVALAPTPAALPAGLALLGVLALRRRH